MFLKKTCQYNKLVGSQSEHFRNNQKQAVGIKRMQFNAALFQTYFVLTKKVTDKLSEEIIINKIIN